MTDITSSQDEYDGPPMVCTVISFDRDETIAADYKTAFDMAVCQEVANVLASQIAALCLDENEVVNTSVEDNIITLERPDQSSLSVSCFGEDVFDICWSPGADEIVKSGPPLRFTISNGIELQACRGLIYRYVKTGNLREDND